MALSTQDKSLGTPTHFRCRLYQDIQKSVYTKGTTHSQPSAYKHQCVITKG